MPGLNVNKGAIIKSKMCVFYVCYVLILYSAYFTKLLKK